MLWIITSYFYDWNHITSASKSNGLKYSGYFTSLIVSSSYTVHVMRMWSCNTLNLSLYHPQRIKSIFQRTKICPWYKTLSNRISKQSPWLSKPIFIQHNTSLFAMRKRFMFSCSRPSHRSSKLGLLGYQAFVHWVRHVLLSGFHLTSIAVQFANQNACWSSNLTCMEHFDHEFNVFNLNFVQILCLSNFSWKIVTVHKMNIC